MYITHKVYYTVYYTSVVHIHVSSNVAIVTVEFHLNPKVHSILTMTMFVRKNLITK